MQRNLNDIRNLIRSRFKAKNITIPDSELERLTRKYGSTDYNLLIIKDQVDLITMMIEANEKKSLFNSEDIGDYLAELRLKQMDINESAKFLSDVIRDYTIKNGIEIDPKSRPYKSEKKVLFMSEDIGDFFEDHHYNQHRMDDAKRYLLQLAKSQKAIEDLRKSRGR